MKKFIWLLIVVLFLLFVTEVQARCRKKGRGLRNQYYIQQCR